MVTCEVLASAIEVAPPILKLCVCYTDGGDSLLAGAGDEMLEKPEYGEWMTTTKAK